MKKIYAALAFIALVALTILGAPTAASATGGSDLKEKITLCHAKGPDAKNGWTVITVDKHAIFTKGHDNHDADIIPPFEYTTNGQKVKQYPGKNYRTIYNTVFEGSQVLQNGCVVPDRPKPPQPDAEVREASSTSIDCVNEIVVTDHTRQERPYVWDENAWDWVPGEWTEPVVTHTPQRPLTEAELAQCELPETGGEVGTALIAGVLGAGLLGAGIYLTSRRKEA